jgi:hypothetical protein
MVGLGNQCVPRHEHIRIILNRFATKMDIALIIDDPKWKPFVQGPGAVPWTESFVVARLHYYFIFLFEDYDMPKKPFKAQLYSSIPHIFLDSMIQKH